jgi:ribosomal protein S18 acetylase RimI-like enzyme|tara:strand:+ start:63 stop:527 length:465 start_codon:yes stop_codon:yes gene_type:complete
MGVRIAIDGDAASIAALGLCVWIDTYATDGTRDSLSKYVLSEFTESNMSNLISSKKVYVSERNEHINGYAVLRATGKLTEIESLYVLPGFQANGIGREILNMAVTNYPGIWLSCWERNERALSFYKSFGFLISGESYFELEDEKHRNILLSYSS